MKKGILYINQFFAGIGGEDMADYKPEIRAEKVGPAVAYANHLKGEVEITHTIICGDNFIGSNTDEAINIILGFLEDKEFDIFFAGPSFRAGRYGVACGKICKAVKDKFKVPVITSMNDENPGVDMFRKDMYIFKGGPSAAAMGKDTLAISKFAIKLLKGEETLPASEEGYFGRGVRKQIWRKDNIPATERVMDMLIKKIKGEPFTSELIIPKKELVTIAKSVTKEELSKLQVAVVTSGGIVPVGNPDKIQSASATKWGKYDISGKDDLLEGEYMTIHAGFDPAAANEDPDRIVPLDVLRVYEKEKKIGGVYKYFYSTVGTGTTQAEAARMGREIADELTEAGIKVALLTST